MSEYKDAFIEENNYLITTIDIIEKNLEDETNDLLTQKAELIQARRDMWQNTTHSANDFDKLTEANQYLSSLQTQTLVYNDTAKRIMKYEKMLDCPYFARIDFTEDLYDDTENIYIGLFNLMDENTHNIQVYDWRAPISSTFYRFEPGTVEYMAPAGIIKGKVSLKRQYKIKAGKLEYFFDSNINILDDMLKDVLSKNMSSKMKTIVETIQRQQDIIIRDLVNEVLVVQGTAGSGKTSVALHRIAFLLYQGLNLKLNSNNIVIISPSSLFSKYISDVLPELGEENIAELTFENIFANIFKNKLSVKTKSEQLESLVCAKTEAKCDFLRSDAAFKGSETFMKIIDRFIKYFERKLIKFEDVYFNGKYIANRHLMKSLLLSSKFDMPTSKKLKIIESRILNIVIDMRKERRAKIETAVENSNRHQFEAKAFTRVIANKETSLLTERIHKFTEFDCFQLYVDLFKDKERFLKLAKGLNLPTNINEIIDFTNKKLDPYNLPYTDGISLLYMKIKFEGCDLFSSIKQVMVDEAQDYYPIHYNILKLLFREARFTIVGDVNQAIEKDVDLSIYDNIISIFNKQKSTKLILNKSYRCSYEISKFSLKLLDKNVDSEFLKRNEGEPEIIKAANEKQLDEKMIDDIKYHVSLGFKCVAIICKSRSQSLEVYFRLKNKLDLQLVDNMNTESMHGVVILPVYMAKGLEFDSVMVYGADDINYKSEYDRKLLYIACTRPLHKLSLYYKGNLSKFLK